MCAMDESREGGRGGGGGGGGVDNINVVVINNISSSSSPSSTNIIEIEGGGGEEQYHQEVCNSKRPTTQYSNFFDRLLFRRQLPVNEVTEELVRLGKIACPVVLTTLFMHSKSIISMLYLGHMGKIELAGGSMAISFANITGYSVMKGLCMGMDPICCQAYGAKRWSLVTQTYLKTVLLLLLTTIPVSFLWLNVETLFQLLGQDPVITRVAKLYLTFSLPELLAHSNLHPLRSFLRTQGLTSPATSVATVATILHLPINYFLVTYMNLGVKGIALASMCHAYNMNIGLFIYLLLSKASLKPWVGTSVVSTFKGWRPLLSLALPSACSVCLEWWWYEIILFLSGLLTDPESSVGAMGILIQTAGAIYVFPYALSLGVSQRVGYELGSGQPARARWAAIVGVCVGLSFGFSIFGLAIALRSVWGKLYTSEPQILELVKTALPLLGMAEIGNAPQTAVCGVLTGSARPKMGVRVNIAAFYLIGLPAVVVITFALKIGFRGLWMGLVASQAACVMMMVYTLYQTDWKHQTKRAQELAVTAGQEEEDTGTNLVP